MFSAQQRRTRKGVMRLGLVLGVAAVLVLGVGLAAAKKPPKPPGPPPPAGVIYANLVGEDWTGDVSQMNADGSGLTRLFGASGDWVLPEPSREVHGGRWFLDFQPRGENQRYPSEVTRHELFAVSESGEAVQLTFDETLEPIWGWYGLDASLGEPRWLPGDRAVSWLARRWGLLPDGSIDIVEMGIYVLDIDFSEEGTPEPVGEPRVMAWTQALPAYDQGDYGACPAVWGYEWSPTGDSIVYGVCNPLEEPLEVPEGLYVADAETGETTFLVPGATQPRWSPDGTKVAFNDRTTSDDSVGVINTDGTGRATVVQRRGAVAHFPQWAPDGTHLVYRVTTRKGKWGEIRESIYRVAVDGSGNTKVVGDYRRAYPLGWR